MSLSYLPGTASLLEELVSSEGNILENNALIQSLEATKQQSSQIEDALANQRQLKAASSQTARAPAAHQ